MELKFKKQARGCLQLWAADVKNEEQTQEIRLPDAMADIGSVLGVWGQALIRSKEWRGSGMSISGGVMVWVLYAAEDGSGEQMVEGWIPFQTRLDFPQAQRDGKIIAECLVRDVDARCVSARKLMVRANISIQAEALEPSEFAWYVPGEMPEDVQLLKRSWPVCMAAEAGEKIFQLDEELMPGQGWDGMEGILRYTLQPEITDRKLMGDRVVFRGVGLVRALVRCNGGQLRSLDLEVPFSQYAQLDQEYGADATVRIVPAVTGLELELQEDGKLRLKAGMTGQYVIYDRPVLELVEDAYSPVREVTLHSQSDPMPVILDQRRELLSAEQAVHAGGQPVDAAFHLGQPVQQRNAQGVQLEIPGQFVLLQRTEQGTLQGTCAKWQGLWQLDGDRESRLLASCVPSGKTQASADGDETRLRCDVAVEVMTVCDRGIPMVTGLELGQQKEPDPARPTLILCRAGDRELWSIAKQAGSTVDAIRAANGLTGEPEPEKMLLIPVL